MNIKPETQPTRAQLEAMIPGAVLITPNNAATITVPPGLGGEYMAVVATGNKPPGHIIAAFVLN